MKTMHTVDTDTFALTGDFTPAANTQAPTVDVPSDKDIVLLTARMRAARDRYVAELVARGFKALVAKVAEWHRTRTTRQALATLDARLLKDIGLDRADVQRAALNAGPGRIAKAVSAMASAISQWNQARLTRSALLSLNDAQLNDIGMTRYDVDVLAREIRAGRWPATAPAVPARKPATPKPEATFQMGKPVNNNRVQSWFMAPRRAA